jgi:hypothetical protein
MPVKTNSTRGRLGWRILTRCADQWSPCRGSSTASLASLSPRCANQEIAPLNAILIHHSVSWMWKAKTHVFGWVDVAPGRMSYWTPGRKNSEGMSWKA